MKKILSTILAFVLVFTICFAPKVGIGKDTAFAAKTSAQAQIDDVQSEIDDVEKEQKKVSQDLSKTASQIKALQAKVTTLTKKISETSSEISVIETKLKAKQKEIEGREGNLYERLVVMYKNGSIGFLDVLLGSRSISELVSNVNMVQRIYKNDIKTLTALEGEHDELAEIQSELKAKKTDLAAQQKELNTQKTELYNKQKELEKKEDELQKQADELTLELLKLIDVNSEYVGGTFTWPCPSSHYISSAFGNRLHPILKVYKMHTGIDIAASTGKSIVAAATGKVIMSKYNGGYGYCIMIDHGGGIVTLYAHCSKLIAKNGAVIKRGTEIAKVGSTGTSTGPHLHFEVRVGGDYVDPMKYFNN